MSLRFLLGVLPSGPPEEHEQSTRHEINGEYNIEYNMIALQNAAKFHIGMLTISLLVGFAYAGYTAYTCWMEKNIFLSYIRNLVIALACRTFFSIIFDGAILLGSPLNVGGANFLISVEYICLNLVIAFWLTLNIYLHERVQRNFNNEPTLIIYQFGVPGVSAFFAFIWIFTFQDQLPNAVWWACLGPFSQWIVNSINLLYLLIQLGLLANIVRAMMKITLDNDAVSLLRKISAMMGVLVLIFWLQFGLSVGRVPFRNPESYLYFFFLIDGLECALICLVLYFFNKWVQLLNKDLTTERPTRTSGLNEILVTGGRGIVTIDSMFVTRESGRWKSPEEEGSKDVVYSSVIEPERLQKTLDLYKRLNIIPTNQVTWVEGEEFYDCQLQKPFLPENSDGSKPARRSGSVTSNLSRSKVLNEDKNMESVKMSEKKQKRNAFYSSKYLIIDSKENDSPKYSQARPSVSSMSGRSSFKDERINQNAFSELMTDELVRKWLNDNSQNMQKNEKSKRITEEKTPDGRKSSSEIVRYQAQPMENTSGRVSSQGMISAISSAVSSVFFGSKADEKKSLEREIAKSIDVFCDKRDSKPIQTHINEQLVEETEINVPVVDKKECENKEQQQEPVLVIDPHKPPVITVITAEEKQNSEAPAAKDEPLKPIISESPKEDTVSNEGQDDTKALQSKDNRVLTNQSEKLPKLNDERASEKDGKMADSTPGKSAKHKPELPVLDILDGTLQVLKRDISLSPKATSEELEKSSEQTITYSDILEYRSQREKSTTETQKPFGFSEAFTSAIGSLISAGSYFFTGRKHVAESVISEAKTQEVVSELEYKHISADLSLRKDTRDDCNESVLTTPTQIPELTETLEEVTSTKDAPREQFSTNKYHSSIDAGVIQKNDAAAATTVEEPNAEKHECVTSAVENKGIVEKIAESDKFPEESLVKTDSGLEKKQEDTSAELNFRKDIEDSCHKPGSSTLLMPEVENIGEPTLSEICPEKNTFITDLGVEKNIASPQLNKHITIPIDATEKAEETKSNILFDTNLPSTDIEMKDKTYSEKQNEGFISEIKSKEVDVSEPSLQDYYPVKTDLDTSAEFNIRYDIKNKYEEAETSNSCDQPNFTFQIHTVESVEKTNDVKNDQDLFTPINIPLTAETNFNPITEAEVSRTKDSDNQNEISEITKKDLTFKKRRKKNETRHKKSNKKLRKFEDRSNNKVDSHLPQYVRLEEEDSPDELFKNHGKTVLSMSVRELDRMETSSDSEFSVEKNKDSIGSTESFSVDQYYSQLMKHNEKFKRY